MKAAPFEYIRVGSVRECVDALIEAGGDGKILAGGQSLVPVLAMRLARPALLVDVNRIPGMSSLAGRDEDTVSVGALTRHADLVEQDVFPLLSAVSRLIGHAAIRSRGTFGGSIAHADPSGELPVVAAALEATVVVEGAAGRRQVVAADLFLGPFECDLADDEMIVRVDLPVPERWGFAELSRRHGDFGLVTAVTVQVQGRWRVAVGGVAGVPYRSAECEALLDDGPLDANRIREAARVAARGIAVSGDLHASADYRRAMTEEFTRRSIEQAVARSCAPGTSEGFRL